MKGHIFLGDVNPANKPFYLTCLKSHTMPDKKEFAELIRSGYDFKGESFQIGAAMFGGELIPDSIVRLPLKTMNRHGLIAGATGTGKTKTLQVISEGLSNASVPVMMMDIKGDLSGIAAAGVVNDKITERCSKMGMKYKPACLSRGIDEPQRREGCSFACYR